MNFESLENYLQKSPQAVPSIDIIDAAIAEKSLREYIRQAWQYVEAKNQFVDNFHIGAICEHLEAVLKGQIRRLVINIPPRCMKSLAVCVFFFTFAWIGNPHLRFIFASYAAALSIRDSLKSRRLILSDWYQLNWGDRYAITDDQFAKIRFDNDHSGYRIATSVDGLGTGEGGDIIIIDDPHNVKEALSDKKRENVTLWFDQQMQTRLDNPEEGAFIIIMQRVHQGDLTGHVLKQNTGYEHLCLPMEFEGNRVKTSLPFEDPRKEIDELLWKKRFPRVVVDDLKTRMGSYAAAGQFQQRPSPLEGNIINVDWFKRYAFVPAKADVQMIVQVWDTAQKDDEITNAPWVCGTWIKTREHIFLIDVFRDWLNYPNGKKAVLMLAQRFKPNTIVVEDKSTGSSILQDIKGLPLIPFEPEGDKITRLATESPAIEAGNVFLPENAAWLSDFIDEIGTFPNSVFKDQADMLSMALKYFREFGFYTDLGDEIFTGDSVAAQADW